jgi:8-oxo-dGTP diphosphatase
MDAEKHDRPKVGIGALIFNDRKILLMKRRGGMASGSWGSGGGHMEYGESFTNSLQREIREEAGIEIGNIKFLCLVNLKEYRPEHYVDIGFVADWKSGEPKILETDKFENWGWYKLDDLPEPLFGPVKIYLEAYKTGKNFFDA